MLLAPKYCLGHNQLGRYIDSSGTGTAHRTPIAQRCAHVRFSSNATNLLHCTNLTDYPLLAPHAYSVKSFVLAICSYFVYIIRENN